MRHFINNGRHRFKISVLLLCLAAVLVSATSHNRAAGHMDDGNQFNLGHKSPGGQTHAHSYPTDRQHDKFHDVFSSIPCCYHHDHHADDHFHDLNTSRQWMRLSSWAEENPILHPILWIDPGSAALYGAPRRSFNQSEQVLPLPNPYIILTATDLPPPVL